MRSWTDEKTASIDWSSVDEVLAHRFSFLSLLVHHPKLRAAYDALAPEATATAIASFLDLNGETSRRSLLVDWQAKGLLTERSERWCRRCCREGHTMVRCPGGSVPLPPSDDKAQQGSNGSSSGGAAGTALAQLQAHLVVVEQRRLAKLDAKGSRRPNKRGPNNRAGGGRPGGLAAPAVVSESWYRATIKSVEQQWEKAECLVAGTGSSVLPFHFDRSEYGLKRIRIGDEVRLRIETFNERKMGVDVTPLQRTLSAEDIQAFIAKCNEVCVGKPVRLMRQLLQQRGDWKQLLAALLADPALERSAVLAVTHMVTYRAARERAIHLPVLRAFLELMAEKCDTGSFFPHFISKQITPVGTITAQFLLENSTFPDVLYEFSDLVLMVRTQTELPESISAPLGEQLLVAVNCCLGLESRSNQRKLLNQARNFLHALVNTAPMSGVVPTPLELSLPPTDPRSVLHPSNLPVLDQKAFADTAEYVSAHCALLKADTFNATTRMLLATCFQLPGYQMDEVTRTDAAYQKLYHRIRFLGKAVSRDWDQSHSYVFKVEAKTTNVNWNFALPRGQFVCFTTGLDRTTVEPSEIFWGVISLADEALRQQGVIVVNPCAGDFEQLLQNVRRNERLGALDNSVLLETTIFFQGFAPVIRAVQQFLGPAGMELPLQQTIVKATAPPTQQQTLVEYIPAYCDTLFRSIIQEIRTRLSLDAGQDAAMQALGTNPVVLVQGPPGTGKSFVGCRICEAFVTLKQFLGSGAALNVLDVERLTTDAKEALMPDLGPVVVITYKNHALDEFLLDLKHSTLWVDDPRRADGTTHRIVRIGGGGTEPELAEVNLNTIMASRPSTREQSQARARVAGLMRRIERLGNEIQQLEKGTVSAAQFTSWLTDEQKNSITYDDLKAWLKGDKYIGRDKAAATELQYCQLLRSNLSDAMAKEAKAKADLSKVNIGPKDEDESDDEGGQLSVFAAMKKELMKEEKDVETARATFISAEAVELATNPAPLPAGIPGELLSLWSLNPTQRHEYLAFLIKRAIGVRAAEHAMAMVVLDNAIILLNHARDEAKLDILKNADVVGLTTTGCAMNQNLLRSLAPSLLVVEEAAEILESQLLACVTTSLKQIVLIGDHYQLQPKVETVEYERVNHMNVSMFERLVGKMKPSVLVEQRRMRPEISALIRPFYREQRLQDHVSVNDRPFIDADGNKFSMVPGLQQPVFMWTHTTPEEMATIGRSKINRCEVAMCTSLVKHFLTLRVKPTSITVITPYLGQRRELVSALRSLGGDAADIRVSTVDRFQGDEGDVIILSLVRTAKLTAFLRMRNRMIVSCSRARHAMVMIGNDELLLQSPHWRQLLGLLEKRQCIGDYLPIKARDGTRCFVGNQEPFNQWYTNALRERPSISKKRAREEPENDEGAADEGASQAVKPCREDK